MPQSIREVMTADPVTLPATTTLTDAARRMRDDAIGIVAMGDLAIERDPHTALADISAAAPNN